MTYPASTDPARPGQLRRDGACLREGVARRHGCRRNWARTTPRTTPTNTAHHQPQRWVEKAGRSIKGSETPQLHARNSGSAKQTSPAQPERPPRPMRRALQPRDPHIGGDHQPSRLADDGLTGEPQTDDSTPGATNHETARWGPAQLPRIDQSNTLIGGQDLVWKSSSSRPGDDDRTGGAMICAGAAGPHLSPAPSGS
jgi:hypothetical protein